MAENILQAGLQFNADEAIADSKKFGEALSNAGKQGAEGLAKADEAVKAADEKVTGFLSKLKEKLDIKPTLTPVVDLKAIRDGEHKIMELREELAKKAQLHMQLTDPAEMEKSLSEMRTMQREVKMTERALKALQGQAEETGGPIGKLGDTMKEKFSTLAGLGAGAGLGMIVDKMFEVGKESQEAAEKLQASFAGDNEKFNEANEAAERLGETYKKDSNEIKAMTEAYVNMGGPTDHISQKMEMIMAIAHRTHQNLNTAAQYLAQSLEGASNSLTRYMPQLKGVTDQSEKLKIMQQALGPDIKAMGMEANDSAMGFDHFGVQLKEFEKAGGQILTRFLSPFMEMASNVLGMIRDGIDDFKKMPEPLQAIAKYGGMVVLAIGAIGIAMTAGIAISKMDIATKIAQSLADVRRLTIMGMTKIGLVEEGAAMSMTTIATGLQTAATWALNAAMVVLTSPVTAIIAGIALLAAGAIYAYNHFAFFKNFVDGLWAALKILWGYIEKGIAWVGHLAQSIIDAVPPIKALVEGVKSVVSWVGNLFSSTKKATEATKEHAEAAKDDADKLEALKKATQASNDEFDAQKKALQDNIKYLEKQITVQLDYIRVQKEQLLTNPKLSAQDRAAMLENIKLAEQNVEELKKVGQAREANLKILDKEDAAGKEMIEGGKSKKGGGKTAAQILKEKFDAEKSAADADFALKSANREREMIAAGASADEIKDALAGIEREKSAQLLKIADDYQKKSLLVHGKGAEQLQKQMTLEAAKAALTVAKGEESAQQVLEKERKAADTKELSAYEQKKAAIADVEQKARAAQKTALANGAITQAQYDANMLAITAKANQDYLAAEKDYYAKKEKAQLDDLNKSIELEKKGVEEHAAIALAQTDDPLKKSELQEAQQLAMLNIEHEQAVKAAQIKGEDTTAIDQDYEAKKTALLQKASDERRAIVLKGLQQDNIAYQAAMDGLKTAFSDMTQAVQSTLGHLFGWEKSQWEQMSATEKALAIQDKNNKEAQLAEEVRVNKISYQDYVLQKQKLEDDFAKKQKANTIDIGKLAQSVEKSITDGIIQNIAKRAEAWVADQLTRLALSLVYKGTDVAASTASAAATAAAWAPAAAMAATASFGGAAVAGGTALAATDAAAVAMAHVPGAAEGEFIQDGVEGRDTVLRRVMKGETIVPSSITKLLGGKDFLPGLKNFAASMPNSAHARNYYDNVGKGNVVMAPHPNVTGSIDAKHLAKFNEVMEHIGKNGLNVGPVEAVLSPKTGYRAQRAGAQRNNSRVSVTGGGMRG